MNFQQSVDAKTSAEIGFDEWKSGFNQTLVELRTLEKRVRKLRTAWEPRLALCQQRHQAALRKNVLHTRLTYLLQELHGGNGRQGVIPSIEPMIASAIARIEQADATIMPHRDTWLTWNSQPARITDSINLAEQWLTEAEKLVADHGELHQALLARAAQSLERTTVQASHAPTEIVVETT